MNILEEANEITDGVREEDYGHPRANHARTAILWNAYMDARRLIGQGGYGPFPAITEEDVCWLNVLQKIARDIHAPKRDNLVDVAGWARNIEKLRTGE